jgi:hypothetical protein
MLLKDRTSPSRLTWSIGGDVTDMMAFFSRSTYPRPTAHSARILASLYDAVFDFRGCDDSNASILELIFKVRLGSIVGEDRHAVVEFTKSSFCPLVSGEEFPPTKTYFASHPHVVFVLYEVSDNIPAFIM